jgi:hypothetical protein
MSEELPPGTEFPPRPTVIVDLQLNSLTPNPTITRKETVHSTGLVESIRMNGIKEPILVRPSEKIDVIYFRHVALHVLNL